MITAALLEAQATADRDVHSLVHISCTDGSHLTSGILWQLADVVGPDIGAMVRKLNKNRDLEKLHEELTELAKQTLFGVDVAEPALREE